MIIDSEGKSVLSFKDHERVWVAVLATWYASISLN